MATTINLVHHGIVVSRWSDARGPWAALPGYKLEHYTETSDGAGYAIIWSPPTDEEPEGPMHVRYKFPGGAEVTQARLSSLLDEARALGRTELTLD